MKRMTRGPARQRRSGFSTYSRAAWSVALAATAAFACPPLARGAGGECRWEGGPGYDSATGARSYCRNEDCIGNGGLAQCTEPVVAAANGDDLNVDAEKWIYGTCEFDGRAPIMAAWCQAAYGTWISSSSIPYCTNLPPWTVAGNSLSYSDSARQAEVADRFVVIRHGSQCPPIIDTGWDTTLNDGELCWTGIPRYQNGVQVEGYKRRLYGACENRRMRRDRRLLCPAGSFTRTRPNGDLHCFKPANTCPRINNPVAPMSGAKLQEEKDYASAGSGGVEFTRYFNSTGHFRLPGSLPAAPVASDYWRHTYDRRLVPVASSELMAVLQRPDGMLWYFDGHGREVLNLDGAAARLVRLTGLGWQLTLANHDVEQYDANSRLTSITTRSGMVTTLDYDANGRLAMATDASGRSLTLAYDTKGRLASVRDPGGGVIAYGYDSLDRPTTVTYPDQRTKTYHYEYTGDHFFLTGITDESGQRFSTYVYDTLGRVAAEFHAGNVNRYEFTYDSFGSRTTVRDPLGTSRQYDFVNTRGVHKLGAQSSGCPGCGNSKSRTYDANGNVAAAIDFRNVQTVFAYDLSRNLETSRTEANGTSEARTISTQWHPAFRLPTQVEEPGRRTTHTHDAAGNPLTRTVKDLTVTPNVSRTWSYTYDAAGRLLTEDGPRTEVSDVTTYTYHDCSTGGACGQVATVTDPLGRVTTYGSYDAHGQPLTITDPNGVLTTLAYDARQRLVSRTVGSERRLSSTGLPDW